MHKKKAKGNKKKSIKKKIRRQRGNTTLSVGQASTIIDNDTTRRKNVDTKIVNDKLVGKKKSIKKGHWTSKPKKRRRTLISDPNAFHCTICGMAYKNAFTLKRHLELYGDPTYPCEECGTKFSDEKQVDLHIAQTHVFRTVKRLKFQCPICRQFIMKLDHFRCHMYHYHKGWQNMYPNLFASEDETIRVATSAVVEKKEKKKIEVKDEKKDTSVRRSNRSSTTTLRQSSRSTITPEKKRSSMLIPEKNDSSTIALGKNSSLTKTLENDIAEMIPPEENVSLAKVLENNITATKTAEKNIIASEAVENIKTPMETGENDNSASEIVVNYITEKAPKIDFTETKAADNMVSQTETVEIDITEAETYKNNNTEIKASVTAVTVPSISLQNYIKDFEKTNYEVSEVNDEMVSPDDKNTPLPNNGVKPDVPIRDKSPSSFVKRHVELNEVEALLYDVSQGAREEKDKKTKSLDDPRHPENLKARLNTGDDRLSARETAPWGSRESEREDVEPSLKGSDKNSSTVSNLENSLVSIAKKSKLNETPKDTDIMNEFKREAELRALYSCKDCYVPLPRLNVQRVNKNHGRSRVSGSHSAGSLFPSTRKVGELLTNLSEVNPNLREIVGKSALVPCTLCGETFSNEAGRLMHVEMRHTVIPSILCNKKFTTRQSMTRHYRQRHFIHDENKTICICGLELIGQTAIDRHFYQYANKVVITKNLPATTYVVCKPLPAKFNCENCGAKFWLETCLNYHRSCKCRPPNMEKILQSKKPLAPLTVRKRFLRPPDRFLLQICRVCNTGFPNEEQLSKHQAIFDRPGTHPCPTCGIVFKGHRQLAGHIHSTHEREPSKYYPFHCSICDQGFTQSSLERIHRMHIHTETIVVEETSNSDKDELSITDSDVSDDETIMKCNVCDLEFSSGTRFVNHLIYYTKNEIIECHICLEEFEGQYKAHRHNKFVHYSSDSQNAFTHHCTICQEGFMWKTQLQSHLCHVHGIAVIETQYIMNQLNSRRKRSQKVNFRNVADTCKICDISFSSPVLLAAHEIENMNDGEFVCNKCSRRCRTASILLDHLSLNHSSTAIQEGVKCRRCNENFQTQSAWVSHVKHFHFTKEPSEFYFEKNLTSLEKLGSSLRYELTIPTNHSINSGMASFRIKTSLDETSYAPVPIKDTYGNADARDVIKLEEPDSTTDSWNNGEMNGLDTETPWKCTICIMSFDGADELARHTALYSDNGQYMCELCGRRFAWLSIYQDHKKKHYRDKSDGFFCSSCNEGFETLQCKISHEAHVHKKSSKVYQPNPRSLLRPKLPSIVSFFQSESANESSLTPQALSYHEQIDDECNSPHLHTEIFEDELSMTYQCPDCHEKYPTLKRMHEHLTIGHNMKQDPTDDTTSIQPMSEDTVLIESMPDDSNTFDSVTCEICDMKFVSKNLLNIHKKMVHSLKLVPIQRVNGNLVSGNKLSSEKRHCSSNDHTYTSENKKLRTVPILSKSKCGPLAANAVNPLEIISQNPPKPNSVNGEIPTIALLIPLSQPNSVKPQPVGQASSMIIKREYVNSAPNNVQTKVSNKFRCNICNIVFMNEKILRAHEVGVHCLIVNGNQSNYDSAKEDSSGTATNAVKQLNRLVGALPIPSKNQTPAAITVDFETIMMPVSTYDFDSSVQTSDQQVTSFSTEKSKPIEPSRIANINSLPPGNYKVSQLKVRPFAKIVEKLQKETVKKSRNNEPEGTTESPAKKIKKVFDPIAYRELCKQHNLIPPSSTKSKTTLKTPLKTPM